MNCRTRWGASAGAGAIPPEDSVPEPALEEEEEEEEKETYPFTPSEVARLEIYRRAIAAGYYTD
jgi:hypothetical protein